MNRRAEIERCRAEFVRAFNGEDLAALRQVCAEDIVMMPPNQPAILGIEAAVEWWTVGFEAFRTAMTVTPRELYVTDGWAFDWFDWSVTIVPLCGIVPDVDSGSSFMIWRRQRDGRWRILRAMWKSSSHAPSVWAGGIADFPIDHSPLM